MLGFWKHNSFINTLSTAQELTATRGLNGVLAEHSAGLGKPTIKFEFNNNDELKEFLTENKENLIESFVDVTPEPDYQRGQLTGAQMPAEFFNVAESDLETFGLKPTYKRLADYSKLLPSFDGKTRFKGYGFNKTTLQTLCSVVSEHWRELSALAKHLKADNEKQSAFNLWHWLHCNIKYNYDTPGREEIRTPARTWHDRENGVDCDCLSVFAYCVLLCMGYKPKFEIVAFDNNETFSHIFVNLNGLAVDRVLSAFGQRPLLITKTIFMEVPVFELSGVPLAGLRGVYENALKKINSNTATADDKLDYAKTKILIELAGSDSVAYRLGAMIMPYVVGFDKDGAYYFRNGDIAQLAKNAENSILQARKRGASNEELNGILNGFWSAIKKVAKAVFKTVTAPVEATVAATKAAVNVTKAGVQAATGNTEAAKESLKDAANNVKDATVTPIVDTAKATADIVEATVIDPTKKTLEIGGKVFKVIFITINPVTVLIRNALRALIAINFLGFATRLNIGSLSQDEATAAGYEVADWEKAKKSYKRVVNFFTKMGGKESIIKKSIENGSKRKALFKKDYKETDPVTIGENDATLGEAATIASCLAAVGSFFLKIWGWIKDIVPKAAKYVAENKETIANTVENVKNVVETVQTVKNVVETVQTVKEAVTGSKEETETTVTEISDGGTATISESTTETSGPNWGLIALIAGAGLVMATATGNKSKKK